MNLYFLRHGDAVRDSRIHDSERPLSDLGQRQARTVGRFLAANGTDIECTLCSPLLRARQTAAAILSELGPIELRTTEHLTSSSDPRHILRELAKLDRENVLLIGHEPHLSATISVLISGDEHSKVVMNPCTLACLSTPAPSNASKAVLEWLIHPELMTGV